MESKNVILSKIKFYFIKILSYKLYLISAKGYENASVDLLVEKETGIMWVSMKNVQGAQNISDLVLKDIYGIHKTKKPYERSN